MSPEQVRGDSSIDHRADQWSAGVMLFELVTGRRPVQGENYNLLILEIMTRRAPRADEVAPSVAPELAAVIARARAQPRSTLREYARVSLGARRARARRRAHQPRARSGARPRGRSDDRR
jgi:serine/threonine-protein kinase